MGEKYISKVSSLFRLIQTRLPGLCAGIVVGDLIAHRAKSKTTTSLIGTVGIWYYAFVFVVLELIKLFCIGTGMQLTTVQCYA
jgi:hypothetical protein